jgi:hypothetical protein
MIERALRPHPAARPNADLVVAAAARRAGGILDLRYRLAGAVDAVILPPSGPPHRRDELWRTTCFEAFLRLPRARGYVEINLSPSSAWAAYRFNAYRKGMTPIDAVAPIPIETSRTGGAFNLTTRLELRTLFGAKGGVSFRLGLFAVIEERGGCKSYWALRHAPGKPDFHNAHCFSIEITGDAAP